MPEFIGHEEAGLDGGLLGGQWGVGGRVGQCGGTWEYFPLLLSGSFEFLKRIYSPTQLTLILHLILAI